MSKELPVLDDWNGYVFPEQGLETYKQRMVLRDPVANPSSGSYAPFRLDSPQDGITGTMMNTLVAVNQKIQDPNSVPEMELNGPDESSIRWFLFSPYEVFLEEVLAERLKTLEIGDLK